MMTDNAIVLLLAAAIALVAILAIIWGYRTRPFLTNCACGCGRLIYSDQPWDGYHGPGTQLNETSQEKHGL